jgi:ADP-ribose pyrophosphatase YjhB (NUDIX family)
MTTQLIGDRPRRVCTQCRFIHFTDPKVGVGVMVVHDGRILLVQRLMNPEKGKWSIPAGFLDRGEDPRETAVREAKEETNLDVRITGLIDVYTNPLQKGGASISFCFGRNWSAGILQAGDDAANAGFFAPDGAAGTRVCQHTGSDRAVSRCKRQIKS